jgi:sarcosine oxidase subunit alpha
VLYERTLRPGGRLRHGAPTPEDPPLPERLGQVDWLQLESTALGLFEDQGERFFIVRTPTALHQVFFDKALLALGGYPSLLTFENNDLPGVYASSAVARLIRQFKMLPGERFALAGEAPDCAPLAKLLRDHGGTVSNTFGRPIRAHGSTHVTDLTVEREGSARKIPCDTIVVCAKASPSFELAEQGGAQVRFNPETGTFQVKADEQGLAAKGLYVAGQLLGPVSAAEAVLSGRRAALAMGASTA